MQNNEYIEFLYSDSSYMLIYEIHSSYPKFSQVNQCNKFMTTCEQELKTELGKLINTFGDYMQYRIFKMKNVTSHISRKIELEKIIKESTEQLEKINSVLKG